MRISCEAQYGSTSIFVENVILRGVPKIMLDGVEVRHCIVADEEGGEVLVDRMSEFGVPIHEDGRVLRDWRRGKVEIIWPKEIEQP